MGTQARVDSVLSATPSRGSETEFSNGKTGLGAGSTAQSTAAANLRIQARTLYSVGRLQEAIQHQVAVVNRTQAEPRITDFKLLSLMLFSSGHYTSAITVLTEARRRWPDDPELQENLAICLIEDGQFEQAKRLLLAATEADAEDTNVLDALAEIYGREGDRESAKRYGERSLILKDRRYRHSAPGLSLALRTVPCFSCATPEKHVIAFSLWGENERYTRGAIRNAEMAREIFPEWRCRFYCDHTVPARVRAQLIALGSDLVLMPPQRLMYEGLFWRFLVANDPEVERFLVRDADSLISIRERAAVIEWIESDQPFHCLRDYYSHTDPILAGLWGGVGNVLPKLNRLFSKYLNDPTKTANCDQRFLREQVWPLIRKHCVIHDSWYRALGARKYPTHTDRPGRWHVGQNASAAADPHFGRVLPSDAAKMVLIPRNHYIFTLTTGRSGTLFLSRLLSRNLTSAEVHHERTGYRCLGHDTPDASQFTTFNSAGNVRSVRSFWRRKFASLLFGPGHTYVETSHFLAKAGLIENLELLGPEAHIHIVCLRRDIFKTAWSLANRFDFANNGFTWLFALDPGYPLNIVDSKALARYGMLGDCVWYVLEMQARTQYYKLRLRQYANVSFHDVALEEIAQRGGARRLLSALDSSFNHGNMSLPNQSNKTRVRTLSDKCFWELREIVDRISFDPIVVAEQFAQTSRFG